MIPTHPDTDEVEASHEYQKRDKPNSMVDALASCPAEKSRAVVVVEFDRVRDSHKLVGGENGIGKPGTALIDGTEALCDYP